MITPVRKTKTEPAWHAAFLAMLPIVERYARFAFRNFGPEASEDAVHEVVANVLAAFARLVEVGKADVAHPGVLARYAVYQYRAGRRVGGRLSMRDVTSLHVETRRRITVERLDRFDEADDEWHEILVEDKHAGPAETAAARIDVAAWFRSLGQKQRQIAQSLAEGETTGTVAQMFGFSAGRVSQLRRELAESWSKFQGQVAMAA
ncbi:MAG TPA: hypothetical protein VGG64_15025 [Pirellulales bacterium]|jgi:hypothetical protein